MHELIRFVLLVFVSCFVLFALGYTITEGYDAAHLLTALKTAAVVGAFAFAYKFIALKRKKAGDGERSDD